MNRQAPDMDKPVVVDTPAPAKNKVQCGKCDHIVRRSFCSVKGIPVARKKAITCDLFATKTNKEPAAPVYVPNYDKYTNRMIRKMTRKMLELGLTTTTGPGDVRVDQDGTVYQRQTFQMPKSTANAGVLGAEPVRVPGPGENTLFSPAPETPEGNDYEPGNSGY
jgi:hypothetical protein